MAVSTISVRHDLTALAVLAALEERQAHPYQVYRQLVSRHQDYANRTARSVYHAVERLASEQLAEPVETSREGRRPERTVFRITDSGREQLQHWLLDLIGESEPGQPGFGAALALLGHLAQGDASRALGVRLARLRGLVAGLEAVVSSLRGQFGLPRLFLLEREYQLAVWRAERDWVEGLIGELDGGELGVDQEWLRQEVGAEVVGTVPEGAVLATTPARGALRLRVERGEGA